MRTTTVMAFGCVLALTATVGALSPERVHLEIAFEQRGGLDTPHRWLNDLKPLQFATLRIRAAQRGETPRIELTGQGPQRRARVVAVLAGESLQLPNGRVRRGDLAAMRAWLTKLEAGDDATSDDPQAAFGLSQRDLQRLQNQLAAPLTEETAGIGLREFLVRCETATGVALVMSRAAEGQVPEDATVRDSMTGLASGTAAAAALRTLSLGMVPTRQSDGSLRLQIEPLRADLETWPVGRSVDGPITQAVPKLSDRIPVEMNGVTLAKALRALQPRMDVPMLIDYGHLTGPKSDLNQVIVNVPANRSRYKAIFDRILSKASLQLQVRTDDGGRPFLWIQPTGSAQSVLNDD